LSVSSQVTIEQDEPQDVVFPTPITQGVWTVKSPDGRTQRSHKPIPGFEHLWYPTAQMQSIPKAVPELPPTVVQPPHQPTKTQIPSKTLKRSRSGRRTQQQLIAQGFSDGEQDNEDASAHTFYIGNINELMKFFERRLDELTMRPLRPIVTAWIRQLEPKRLSLYGGYHKELPKDQPLGRTPPWWPQDVPYLEPSHLDKKGRSHLTVTTLVTYLTFCRSLNVGSRFNAPAPPN
jgi:hypothetical protein